MLNLKYKKYRKKALAIVVASASVLVGTAAVSAWANDGLPDKDVSWQRGEPVNVALIQEQVTRDLFNDEGYPETDDHRLARLARENPGGFGGFYISKDRRTAHVYMKDPSFATTAESIFRSYYRGMHDIESVVAVPADYSMDELLEWYVTLNRALPAAGIQATNGALYEIHNQIRYGIYDPDQIDDAQELLAELNIPQGAVQFSQG